MMSFELSHVRALLFAVVVVASVGAAPRLAAAQPTPSPRVVVQQFNGPQGSGVRRALIRDLEDNGVVVVDDEEVRAAREQLGFERSLEEEQYVELARQLSVSAFIDGRVRRARRRWSATVRVRNAFDGQELGSESWGGRTAASLNGIGRNGYSRLREHLDQGAAPNAAPVVADTGETPWYARRDEEELPPDEEEEEEAPSAPVAESDRYDAIRFALGGGTLFRSMASTVTVYAAQRRRMPADPASELLDESRRYQSGGIGHFELGGLAELYPGAFGDQPFPYLGVVVSFSHSVGVQSNGLNRMTGDAVAVPTNQLDFYVGARGRYRFGPNRREPELFFDVGWGTFNFDLGLTELAQIELDTIIPPMQHGYVRLGAGIRYGVVPTYLTLGLDVAGHIGTNIGGETRNVWGTTTAPSNGFQVGAEARVEIPEIVRGFFFALRLQYFQMITDFTGQVGCATDDGCGGFMNPWEDPRLWEVWPVAPPGTDLNAVVGGPQEAITDHYFRLQLQVGYAFY